ncbi:MAG: hypothetical protein ACYC27_16290 [Armatimonadota bacterium]
MRTTLKPGEKAPITAQYEVIGSRGGRINKEVQSTKGEPMPPTEKPGQTYRPVDPVKNKSGRR